MLYTPLKSILGFPQHFRAGFGEGMGHTGEERAESPIAQVEILALIRQLLSRCLDICSLDILERILDVF